MLDPGRFFCGSGLWIKLVEEPFCGVVIGGLAFPVRTRAVEEPFWGAFDFDFGSGMGAGTMEAYSEKTRAARAFLLAPPSKSSFNAPASNWARDRFLFSMRRVSRDGGS